MAVSMVPRLWRRDRRRGPDPRWQVGARLILTPAFLVDFGRARLLLGCVAGVTGVCGLETGFGVRFGVEIGVL